MRDELDHLAQTDRSCLRALYLACPAEVRRFVGVPCFMDGGALKLFCPHYAPHFEGLCHSCDVEVLCDEMAALILMPGPRWRPLAYPVGKLSRQALARRFDVEQVAVDFRYVLDEVDGRG